MEFVIHSTDMRIDSSHIGIILLYSRCWADVACTVKGHTDCNYDSAGLETAGTEQNTKPTTGHARNVTTPPPPYGNKGNFVSTTGRICLGSMRCYNVYSLEAEHHIASNIRLD